MLFGQTDQLRRKDGCSLPVSIECTSWQRASVSAQPDAGSGLRDSFVFLRSAGIAVFCGCFSTAGPVTQRNPGNWAFHGNRCRSAGIWRRRKYGNGRHNSFYCYGKSFYSKMHKKYCIQCT